MKSEMTLRPSSRGEPRRILQQIWSLKNFGQTLGAISFSFATLVMGQPAQSASSIDNACKMMQERPAWYSAAKAASEKWHVPISSILAIIRQESRFVGTAASRRSSAYGYAQALDGTWRGYRRATKAHGAVRTSFSDSVDFVAWYMTQSRKRAGLPNEDVASHYLAYHEGHAGYRSTRWVHNPRLIRVSHRVAETAWLYQQQLDNCVIVEAVYAAPALAPKPAKKPFGLSVVSAELPRQKPADRYMAELSPSSHSRPFSLKRFH